MQQHLFTSPCYKFFSLGSGSSGNCYYLGTTNYGILIDAGIGIRNIRKSLKEYGIAIEKILAVLITHDHSDHIKAVGCLGDKLNIPVYTTQAVHEGIERNRYVHADLTSSKRIIEKEIPFSIKDLEITAFDVPHDSIENVGYHIAFGEQVFVLITDAGRITDRMIDYASKANHLVIEANYDPEMLQNGTYSPYLKQRITCGTGHLSNEQSAQLISDIANDKMKNLWLCHLSEDNNHPELAYKTVALALAQKGIIAGEHLKLEALSRLKPSGLRELQ